MNSLSVLRRWSSAVLIFRIRGSHVKARVGGKVKRSLAQQQRHLPLSPPGSQGSLFVGMSPLLVLPQLFRCIPASRFADGQGLFCFFLLLHDRIRTLKQPSRCPRPAHPSSRWHCASAAASTTPTSISISTRSPRVIATDVPLRTAMLSAEIQPHSQPRVAIPAPALTIQSSRPRSPGILRTLRSTP